MQLLKSFSIYTIGYLLSQAINFLLIPVFTHFLSPVDYGILALISTITSFATPIILINMDGAISIEYYKKAFNNLSSYISSCFANSIVVLAAATVVLALAGFCFPNTFSFPKIWLITIPVFCFMEGVKNVNVLLFQIKKKPYAYALYTLSGVLLNICLSLIFVAVLKYNYAGRLFGQYIVSFIYCIIGIIILKRQQLVTFKIKKDMMKDALHFGVPLIPHAIGFIIINLADRFFVAHFAGNAQLGIYSLAYTLGSIIFMIAMAFNTAWTPYFFELLEQNTVQSKTKIVKVTYLFIAGLFIATLGLSVLTPFIFKYFINQKFSAGAAIVPWVAFSCFFFGCYLAFTNYISYLKKNKIFAYVSIINITLNMLLNFLLIKQYGIFGAALATFCSFCFFALIIAFVAIKIYPMPWLNVSFKTLKSSDE